MFLVARLGEPANHQFADVVSIARGARLSGDIDVEPAPDGTVWIFRTY